MESLIRGGGGRGGECAAATGWKGSTPAAAAAEAAEVLLSDVAKMISGGDVCNSISSSVLSRSMQHKKDQLRTALTRLLLISPILSETDMMFHLINCVGRLAMIHLANCDIVTMIYVPKSVGYHLVF